MNQTYMKEKPVLKLILSFSLPMMLSMMVSSLYNIIDSIFVARINENAMAAISIVYPVQNFITSVAVGFGVGINAMIGLYLGGENKKKADITASQGVILSIVHGIVINICGILAMPYFLTMFTSDKTIVNLGVDYSNIILCFTIINMIGITFEKIFQAVGKIMVSMISMISGCIVNIILDPIMIFGLGPIPAMGIKGAAYATGIGQTVSMIIYLIIYFRIPLNINISFKYIKEKIDLKLYTVGIPAILNMALPSFLISALNGILTNFSPMYVVVLGIYYKLQTFIYMPANGIIQGMRPIMSYNYGAKEHDRVKEIYKISLILIAGMMFIGMILCFMIPNQLVGMFTDNIETLNAGVSAMKIISVGFVISAISVTSCGALESFGKGVESLMISLLRYIVIIIPIAFFLSRICGVNGVWHGFWITEIIVAILSCIIYFRIDK